MRVFIVDDNEALLQTGAMLIELLGYDVRACGRALDAVKIATEFRPDIAVLDIGMPELDGYELCRRLRKVPALSQMRIVAQSGYGDAESVQRSKDAGFDAHLLKPVPTEELERVLRERHAELTGTTV